MYMFYLPKHVNEKQDHFRKILSHTLEKGLPSARKNRNYSSQKDTSDTKSVHQSEFNYVLRECASGVTIGRHPQIQRKQKPKKKMHHSKFKTQATDQSQINYQPFLPRLNFEKHNKKKNIKGILGDPKLINLTPSYRLNKKQLKVERAFLIKSKKCDQDSNTSKIQRQSNLSKKDLASNEESQNQILTPWQNTTNMRFWENFS